MKLSKKIDNFSFITSACRVVCTCVMSHSTNKTKQLPVRKLSPQNGKTSDSNVYNSAILFLALASEQLPQRVNI